MITSSICSGDRPARSTAVFTTRAPSWGAVIDLSAPWNFPTGVRTALMMTISFIIETSKVKSITNAEAQRHRGGTGSIPNGTRSPSVVSVPLCLPEVEIHFDIQRHINWYAIPHAWLEPPLL